MGLRPTFVRPCNNMFQKESIGYAESEMQQMINELTQAEQQLEVEQQESPKKNKHPLEDFLPSKNPNLPKNSFRKMDKLRKFKV